VQPLPPMTQGVHQGLVAAVNLIRQGVRRYDVVSFGEARHIE
jgi:hypothetical protein